jgi:hypothetical protein
VPFDHPWYLAYLSYFGDLPTEPDQMNWWNELPRGLTYQDVAEIHGVTTDIGAAGMCALVRARAAVSAVDLTHSKLGVGLPAATNRGFFPETSRFDWDDDRTSRRYGPNIRLGKCRSPAGGFVRGTRFAVSRYAAWGWWVSERSGLGAQSL